MWNVNLFGQIEFTHLTNWNLTKIINTWKKKIMVYCLKTQTTVQYSWYIINFIIIISKEKLRFIQAASSCIDNLI